MSTFMAFAVADLRPGTDRVTVLAALDRVLSDAGSRRQRLTVNFWETDGQTSLGVVGVPGEKPFLDEILVRVAAETGGVERAIVAADYDEYGVEQLVLDGRSGGLVRIHHVFVHPEGDDDGEGEPELHSAPIGDGLTERSDGTVDGPEAWTEVAELYGVPPDRIAEAQQGIAQAHEEMGSIFGPFQRCWSALGVRYPGPPEFTAPDAELDGSGLPEL